MNTKQALLLLLTLALMPLQALAALSSVSGSNTPSTVQITPAATSIVSWTATRQVHREGTYTVYSTSGSFVSEDGKTLDRVASKIDDSVRATDAGTITFKMSETLVVPLTVIRTVQQQGDSVFYYQRTFVDESDGSRASAKVRFTLQSSEAVTPVEIISIEDSPTNTTGTNTTGTTSGTGTSRTSPPTYSLSNITVTNTRLLFDDNSKTAIIQKDAQMRAIAVVNYNGSGIISYTWELASPPSTQGTPVYLPLETRRHHLMAGGRISISSPKLPSKRSGEYLLRLRIDTLSVPLRTEALRYAVRAEQKTLELKDAIVIETDTPAAGALLMATTEFHWQDIPGARAYQLELFDTTQINTKAAAVSGPAPITGIIVPADKNRLSLGAVSRTHLISGKRYFWHVIALAGNGHVIGRSKLKEIIVP